jgi:hypothetical protein
MLRLALEHPERQAGAPAFTYHRPRRSLISETCFLPTCMCEIIAAIKGLSPSCRLPHKRSNVHVTGLVKPDMISFVKHLELPRC